MKQESRLTPNKDDYKMRCTLGVCKNRNMNPRSMQRQLKYSFIKPLFESKNVNNITFHYLQQLVHIYNNI